MMKSQHYITSILSAVLMLSGLAIDLQAGPYTEPGIAGYVDADGLHANPLNGSNPQINPIFRGWATGIDPNSYRPADVTWISTEAGSGWDNYSDVPGPATGRLDDVVSLGDLDTNEIAAGKAPGEITLTFGNPDDPNDLSNPIHAIRNGRGYDFAVFENGFLNTITNKMMAELAYVEVSTDGVHFARFPGVSLTPAAVGAYGSIDISNVYNLAGKHPNAYGQCYGTPFNLDDIAGDPAVLTGQIDLNNIRYVRIVDIPGSGSFFDNAQVMVNPADYPHYNNYSQNNPIYDAWVTWGSGGFDLEAIGVLHEQTLVADINFNGVVDLLDFAILSQSWMAQWGRDASYAVRADVYPGDDYTVDSIDLAAFAAQWLQSESWRVGRD